MYILGFVVLRMRSLDLRFFVFVNIVVVGKIVYECEIIERDNLYE